MTTIEKIRVEIERQIKDPQEHCYGVSSVNKLRELLFFLDTLELEKPMNLEDFEKALDNECKRYFNSMTPEQFLNTPNTAIARHFANWGAEHLANSNDEVVINGHKVAYDKDKDAITMEEIPNDLEEAAVEYSKKVSDGHNYRDLRVGFIAGYKYHTDRTPLPEDTVLFNKGVEDGKRLMMEEAVEGEYGYFSNVSKVILPSEKLNLKEGDKARIIIVKEDKK